MKKPLIYILLIFCSCSNQAHKNIKVPIPGAYQFEKYLPLLENKTVALCVNHSSIVGRTHLSDTLLSMGIKVKKIFTPEHGFRGKMSNGAIIEYSKEQFPFELISLYGKSKKPSISQLEGIEMMVFDMQDVGVRFYTYISTMHYVMEACAERNIPVIILDRPNPNGSYVDGPVLDTAFSSFVGIHPIPIVHGLTVGELAQMINGEGWLKNKVKCKLKVIPIKNWTHQTNYSLPTKPSPNLPNDLSISLYPSLCLFEGTIMSVGRGTDHPFQQIGHPLYPDSTYSFTPISKEGSKRPPYEGELCFGINWFNQSPTYQFNLSYLIEVYRRMNHDDFFNDYFKKLVGTSLLQKQIEQRIPEKKIRKTWKADLDHFKKQRQTYLLYENE